MFVVVWSWIFAKNFRGLAIFPFIFLQNSGLKNNRIIINHEKIHIRQQLEMLMLPFFLWYTIEYAVRWIRYGDSHRAYRNISFEREAYAMEGNLEYLKNRKFYSFLRYL